MFFNFITNEEKAKLIKASLGFPLRTVNWKKKKKKDLKCFDVFIVFIIPLGSLLIVLGTISLSTDCSQNPSCSPWTVLKASSLFLLFLSIAFTVILISFWLTTPFSHGSFILTKFFFVSPLPLYCFPVLIPQCYWHVLKSILDHLWMYYLKVVDCKTYLMGDDKNSSFKEVTT